MSRKPYNCVCCAHIIWKMRMQNNIPIHGQVECGALEDSNTHRDGGRPPTIKICIQEPERDACMILKWNDRHVTPSTGWWCVTHRRPGPVHDVPLTSISMFVTHALPVPMLLLCMSGWRATVKYVQYGVEIIVKIHLLILIPSASSQSNTKYIIRCEIVMLIGDCWVNWLLFCVCGGRASIFCCCCLLR